MVCMIFSMIAQDASKGSNLKASFAVETVEVEESHE